MLKSMLVVMQGMQDERGMGKIPGQGGSPGERNGCPLQDSCWETHGQRSWEGCIYEAAKSWTHLSWCLLLVSTVQRRVNVMGIFCVN